MSRKRPPREAEQELGMKRCLIIDDSSVIRKVARRIFEGFGFTISEAVTL